MVPESQTSSPWAAAEKCLQGRRFALLASLPMRLLRPSLSLFALLLAAALGLAACGGGGGGATTEATEASTEEAKPALTREELITQGDGICAEVNTAVGSVVSSAAQPSSQATQVANLYVNLVSSLEQLGTPKEGGSEYAEVIAAAEDLAKIEGEVKLAAEREDSAALTEAEAKAATALEQFQLKASAFGFEQCAQGPSAPPVAPSAAGEGEVEEGGVGVEEGAVEEYVPPEEEGAVEEVVPEGGGGGAGVEEEAAPEGGGEEESASGGVGPG